MNAKHVCTAAVFGLILLAAGCGQSAKQPQEKQYDIVGKVTAVADDKKSVTIDHQEIPGLMKAMEMEFKVATPDVLAGIQKDDPVRGKLQVQKDEHIIVELKKQ